MRQEPHASVWPERSSNMRREAETYTVEHSTRSAVCRLGLRVIVRADMCCVQLNTVNERFQQDRALWYTEKAAEISTACCAKLCGEFRSKKRRRLFVQPIQIHLYVMTYVDITAFCAPTHRIGSGV